jgi:hypothetical protein
MHDRGVIMVSMSAARPNSAARDDGTYNCRDPRNGLLTMVSPTRARDIKAPRHPNDEDFEEICRTFEIGKASTEGLREFLFNFVEAFANLIRSRPLSPDLPTDRDALQKALRSIRAAQKNTPKRIGSGARRGLRALGRSIGPALSARWLREQFPGDSFAPQPQVLFEHHRVSQDERLPARIPSRPMTRRCDVEEMSIEARIQCVSHNPLETTRALLNLLECGLMQALEDMLHLPRARGGRRPLDHQKYGLVNLARAWHNLGRQPTSGPKSPFLAFSEAVFVAIGWPANGLASAMPRAITDWKNLNRKFSR